MKGQIMINNSRSMNEELLLGTVDGKYKFLRPDAADPEWGFAEERSSLLHPNHYGTLGSSRRDDRSDTLGIASPWESALPDDPARDALGAIGVPGFGDHRAPFDIV